MHKKTLILLRHAKAEAGSAEQDDHARVLASRGVLDLGAMAGYVIQHAAFPDLVLCSTAVRTAETLMKLEEHYKRTLPVEYNRKLYLASGGELANIIAQVPETVSTLMVIAHNPGLHQLALKLARKGDDALLDTLSLKFPTAAFAQIDLGEMRWDMIRQASGTLTHFMTPKGLLPLA